MLVIPRDRMMRLLRFGSGAALSFGGTLAVTFVSKEWLALQEEFSFAIAVVVMFFVNFFYLRYVVFLSTHMSWLSQMRDFLVASIGFRVVEYLAFLLLLNVFHLHYMLSVVCVLAVSFLVKFQLFDRHVFKPRH
jgi:putative flippase GtrA